MKKVILSILAISFLLSGCQSPRVIDRLSNRFSPLPPNPSFITITKHLDSNPNNKTSYTLTGKKMDTLYSALQKEAQNVIKPGASYNCPSYTQGTPIWDYEIIVHYPTHANLSFTQTDSTGCVELQDDQTGARAMGYLPGLNPFAKYDIFPPLTVRGIHDG